MFLAFDTNASTAVNEELTLEDVTAAAEGLVAVVVETTTRGEKTGARPLSTVVFEPHLPVTVMPELMAADAEHFRPSDGLQRRADTEMLANGDIAPPFTAVGVRDFSPSVFNEVVEVKFGELDGTVVRRLETEEEEEVVVAVVVGVVVTAVVVVTNVG